MLHDNGEGFAAHSEVIATILLTLVLVMYPHLQVDVESLEEK